MKITSAFAVLALASLTSPMPASAAKDEKLARCNGKQKRPANLYGTVLPTVPDRAAAIPASPTVPHGTPQTPGEPNSSAPPATNLFPSDAPPNPPLGADTSRTDKVPAIGAVTTSSSARAALPPKFASC